MTILKELEKQKSAVRFGTDGWRARIAEDFTFGNVRKVAWALGQILLKENPVPGVLVGFDRRFLSEEFAMEAAAVLAGTGVPTTLAQSVLPTPAFSYLAKKRGCYALVVTASHNPPMDNGLKIKTPRGASAPESLTAMVENLIEQAPDNPVKIRCLRDESLRVDYIEYLKSLSRGLASKLKLKKIVIDYLHGSSSGLLEEVLSKERVVALRSEKDSSFGGIAPEPVEKNLANLKTQVKKSKALIGIALDGDGDRIALVDEKGVYLAPTVVFPMYAYYHALVKKEKGEIVQGVSLGYLGERIAQKAELNFHWVNVGFKNIAQRMGTNQVLIGGEESGGYALGRLIPDRDGLANALLMIRILTDLKLTPSALVKKIFKELGASYYERFDHHISQSVDKNAFNAQCRDDLLPRLQERGLRVTQILDIDGQKIFFDDGSWLLLRASGTEALIRLYAETPNKNDTRELIEIARDWIQKITP